MLRINLEIFQTGLSLPLTSDLTLNYNLLIHHRWCCHDCDMSVASHSVLLMLSLVCKDLGLPVFHSINTGPLLDSHTVQNLIIPSLHSGDNILKAKSKGYQLVHLRHWEVHLIHGMKDIHVKSRAVLPESLE